MEEPAEEQNERSAHYGRGLPIMAGGFGGGGGGGRGLEGSFMCRVSHIIEWDEGVKRPLLGDILTFMLH